MLAFARDQQNRFAAVWARTGIGLHLLKMAVKAQEQLDADTTETDFYKSKLLTTGFYFDRLLTRTRSLVSAIHSGADNLMAMPESMFAIE